MKIKILGSGGGESFPATFCACEHCETARRVGGKSIRTLSQTLINDDLLIDFPSDTDSHCVKNGIHLGKIQNVLITHAHLDHYMPTCVFFRGSTGAHNLKYEKLYFHGPNNLEQTFDGIHAIYGALPLNREHVCFVVLENQKSVKIGNYTITPLTALHAPHLNSLNYIIEKDGKRLLYLIDSGYPTQDTLAFLETKKYVFDCIIMDGTMGVAPPKTYIYHMGFEENKALKKEFLVRNLATDKTRFIVTHITHNKAETHEKIEEIFSGSGIDVAYDSYEIEI